MRKNKGKENEYSAPEMEVVEIKMLRMLCASETGTVEDITRDPEQEIW